MSSSSSKTWNKGPKHLKLCGCGDVPVVRMSLTEKNFGRRFFGCSHFGHGTHCDSFVWIDGETCPQGVEAGAKVAKKIAKLERELQAARERESVARARESVLLDNEARAKTIAKQLKIVIAMSWILFVVVWVM